jgi:hypothetical protein
LGQTVASLRAVLEGDARSDTVRLSDLVSALDRNSFPMLVLVFALLLVSPLSAIPGATSLFGMIIATIVAQMLLGRDHVWLPRFLLARTVPRDRFASALDWLAGPAARVDTRIKARWHWVFVPPMARLPMTLVLGAAIFAPVMEVIPLSGTSVGAAVVLFSAGMLTRDGVFVLVGACLAALMPASLWMFLT